MPLEGVSVGLVRCNGWRCCVSALFPQACPRLDVTPATPTVASCCPSSGGCRENNVVHPCSYAVDENARRRAGWKTWYNICFAFRSFRCFERLTPRRPFCRSTRTASSACRCVFLVHSLPHHNALSQRCERDDITSQHDVNIQAPMCLSVRLSHGGCERARWKPFSMPVATTERPGETTEAAARRARASDEVPKRKREEK